LTTDPRAARPDEPESPAAQPSPASAPADAVEEAIPATRSSRRRNAIILIVAVIVLDILAVMFVPPAVKGEPGKNAASIGDLIEANLELPHPEVVFDLDKEHGHDPLAIAFNDPTISNTILTTWIVIAVLVVVAAVVVPVVVVAAVEALIGLAALSLRTLRASAVAGLLALLAIWVIGQDLGQLYTGQATDPNTGLIAIVVGIGLLAHYCRPPRVTSAAAFREQRRELDARAA